MSRSLSRIRSLVTEIEEIHRQGQQGGHTALSRSHHVKPISAPISQEPLETKDILNETPNAGKVEIQLSGTVVLSVQIENANETIEIKQIGNLLEIRFADGKAFHLPLKAVA